jgi:hypothetical protein
MPESGQLPALFHSENAICAVTSYNKFKNWDDYNRVALLASLLDN